MNRVIMNIGIIRYILNSKYKVISIDLITRFHERRDYEYWNYDIYFKFKIKSHFNHELRDYEYWNHKIYFKFKI